MRRSWRFRSSSAEPGLASGRRGSYCAFAGVALLGWVEVAGAAPTAPNTAVMPAVAPSAAPAAAPSTAPATAPSAPAAPPGVGSRPPAAPGAEPTAAEARRAQAYERFKEGVRAYEAGELQRALTEFEGAYELVPHYHVLYNIGRASFQLGEHARARTSLELYLQLGGAALSQERVAEVQADLEELRTRTATFSLTSNVADASVALDAVRVEPTRWLDIVVEPGQHSLQVSKAGYTSVARQLSVGAGDDVHVVVQLMPLPSAPLPLAVPREQTSRAVPLLPWTVSGLLAAGWLTTVALAVRAQADKDELEQPQSSPQRLDAAVARLKTLAIVSDVLLAATVASVGVSAYVTWAPEAATAGSGSLANDAELGRWSFVVRGEL